MLRSSWSDYSDGCIVVKDTIIVEDTNDAKKINKKLTFKYNGPFRWCISKIKYNFVDNADNFYSITSGSFLNFYIDEVNHGENEIMPLLIR